MVGLEPYYSQALMLNLWWCPPLARLLSGVQLRGSAFSPHFLCLSTLVCLYRYGSELQRRYFFFILLYFPRFFTIDYSRNISTSENSRS